MPNYVKTATGNNLAPKTLPNALYIIIALCGAILALKPTDHQTQSLRGFVGTRAYSFLLAAIILAGFVDAFSLNSLPFALFGVTLGQIVGAVPDIGPIIAITIPFTFALGPLVEISFLIGLNKGELVAGAQRQI